MIIAVLLGLTAIRLFYWLYFFLELGKYRPQLLAVPDTWPGVSVIICAKNAQSLLQENLPSILEQNYPNFEVVVIDDFSEDGTLDFLKSMNDKRLKFASCTQDRPGKKAALDQGIALAKHDWILVSDADCRASSKIWISSMMHHAYNAEADIVMGYGPMRKTKGWVNLFSRFETVMTAAQYMGYQLKSLPYMAVGRNMMFSRELYESHRSEIQASSLASGDDDLFIQAAATATNSVINLDPRSYMISDSEQSWSGFLRQKSRHISTSVRYKWGHKLLLGLYALSWMTYYGVLVASLWTPDWTFALMSHALFVGIVWLIFSRVARKLGEQELIRYLLPFDMLMAIYYFVLPFIPLFTKRNTWN